MADEDKLINVIVKYTQQGAETVAKTSSDNEKTFNSSVNTMRENFSKLTDEQRSNWEKITPNIKKVAGEYTLLGTAMKNLTEEQAKAWANISEKVGQASKPQPSLAAPGGPFDPEGPRKYNTELENTEKQFHAIRMAGRELGQIGNFVALLGGALSAGLAVDAANYVKTMGNINSASAEWLGYEEDIKKANLGIGEVATQALLPAMKSSAEFMERIAAIAKQNPWLVQTAVTVGGILVAIGASTRIISEIMRVTADIGLLLAKLELFQAKSLVANSQGGFGGAEYLPGGAGTANASIGTIALTAGALIIGAELGSMLGNALGQILYGEAYKKQNIGDAFMTWYKMFEIPGMALIQLLNKINPGFSEFGNLILGAIGKMNQFVGGVVGANEYKPSGANSVEQANQQEVDAYIGFQKQINSAQENYSQQRADTIAQYEQQIVDATTRYEEQRANAISSYNLRLAREAEDYARQRANSQDKYNQQVAKVQESGTDAQAKDLAKFHESTVKSQQTFQLQSQRSAQAHALEMQRMEQQHNAKLGDLAASRDALGIVKENQAFALQVSQKNQDYAIAESQRKQDFQKQQAEAREQFQQQAAERQANIAKQLADMKAAHEQEVAEAAAAYKLRQDREAKDQAANLAKMDAAHKVEMAKLEKQEAEKLAKMSDAYNKQITLLQTAFIDRLRTIDNAILGDRDAFIKHMQQQGLEFQAWLANFKSQQAPGKIAQVITVGTGRQYGGYAQFGGVGETGRPEFVMSGDSTRMAEGLIGSRLNQANLMASLMGAKGTMGTSGRHIQITVQSRNLTLSEIKSQVDSALNMRLSDLMPAFGA